MKGLFLRFRFFVLGLVVFIVVVLGIFLYKRGYFITGNLYTKNISLSSRKLVSTLRRYLIEDKNRIVWWKLEFLNKIEVGQNKLMYGSTAPDADVVIGCAQNRVVLGGLVKIVEVFINPNLWTVEGQKKYNILFVRCSVLSYDKDYQDNVIGNFVSLFNQGQFILKKR